MIRRVTSRWRNADARIRERKIAKYHLWTQTWPWWQGSARPRKREFHHPEGSRILFMRASFIRLPGAFIHSRLPPSFVSLILPTPFLFFDVGSFVLRDICRALFRWRTT